MRAETNQPDAEYDPDAGGVGYLTYDQFDRLGRAVANGRKHVAWWRIAGHIKLGDPEEHQTRSSDPTIPLPATWLAAEEVTRLLGELNSWQALEDAVNTLDGQFFATLLISEVETAMAKWPMSDRPHKVRFLRCRACQQQTLKYYPPNVDGPKDAPRTTVRVRHTRKTAAVEQLPVADVLDVNVKCTNPECRAVEDPAMFERDALLIRLESERGKSRRLDSVGGRPDAGGQVEINDLPVGA